MYLEIRISGGRPKTKAIFPVDDLRLQEHPEKNGEGGGNLCALCVCVGGALYIGNVSLVNAHT